MSNAGMTNATNAVMQGGEPIRTYKKAILGKVFINVWNSFEEKPEGMLLAGKESSEDSMYDIWNEKELRFFELMNKRTLETGHVIAVDRTKIEPDVVKKADYTDEELEKILRDKYFTLRSFLKDVDSVPVVFRLLTIAEKIDKPAKTIDSIKDRLAELQSFEPKVAE